VASVGWVENLLEQAGKADEVDVNMDIIPEHLINLE
jgi:hypothetical protein